MAHAFGGHFGSNEEGIPLPFFPRKVSEAPKLVFDKGTNIFRPGDTIFGQLNVHKPSKCHPEVKCLVLRLTGLMFVKDLSGKAQHLKRNIVEVNLCFYGTESGKSKELKPGEHKFALLIPDNIPNSFTNGKHGMIKYTLSVLGEQNGGKQHWFDSRELIIVAKSLTPATVQSPVKPNSESKRDSTVLQSRLSKNDIFHISFTTDQATYEPEAIIHFKISIENRDGTKIKFRTLALQFVQIVSYYRGEECGECTEEIVLVEQSVTEEDAAASFSSESPSNLDWNGELTIPYKVQPSIQSYIKPIPISFQYGLKVLLQGGKNQSQSLSEIFHIDICCPFSVIPIKNSESGFSLSSLGESKSK